MGSFVEELWSSVFTPGPTPTLLVATNVTFAALQVVLFSLLVATYSIHFVILSLLSGSLWYSINWFAREVRAVQAAEAEKEKKEKQDTPAREIPEEAKDKHDGNRRKTPGALDSDSDTETESISEHNRRSSDASAPDLRSTPVPTLQPPEASGEVRKRSSVGGDSSGYVSTDSEWEKVEDSNGA
ncbi:Pkr1-domain-containing protein [Aspergillus steynii IBT 23096]|uniref:Pkr1-domain-containing protein n=1 Tax=Aspergillus steynii IBT 23096 TaxID=1392250 RepID=A0A2I2GS93_9EURO|nr:Pkr1-domain-containing protein [Aspergillus steynii IBT 23096]PLB55736.1 Pkr1-domain-containing protein [Aspergillus steynii IBT 23096]